jgi:hypothetical protein
MASKSLAAGPLLAIAITVMVPKGHGEGVGDGDDNQASREDDKSGHRGSPIVTPFGGYRCIEL